MGRDYDAEQLLEDMRQDEIANDAWLAACQFEEEFEYQKRLADSYPRDERAMQALGWLERYAKGN